MGISKDTQENRLPSRRYGTPEQGRALELLGHAIEYLIDSYVLYEVIPGPHAQADLDAIRLLMWASLEIFSECKEVVPFYRRFWRSIFSMRPAIR